MLMLASFFILASSNIILLNRISMNRSPLLLLIFCCVALLYINNSIRQALNSFNKIFFVTVSFFFFSNTYGEKVFDFNATCQQAYQQITSLKLDAGEQLVNQARRENPDNLIPEILDNYIDFYVLFFNEDPNDYKQRLP